MRRIAVLEGRVDNLLDLVEKLHKTVDILKNSPGSGGMVYGVTIPGFSGTLRSACDMVATLEKAVFANCPKTGCEKCHSATPHKCKAWEVE